MDRKKRWLSAARCVEGILANFAVIGLGLAAYEQKVWPAAPLAAASALLAIFIAWKTPHD